MPSEIYWIEHTGPFKLAIMARPRAGDWLEYEVDNWKSHGVELVVSLLERGEVDDLDLRDEAGLCRARGIEFGPCRLWTEEFRTSCAPWQSLLARSQLPEEVSLSTAEPAPVGHLSSRRPRYVPAD
jgi:hypothetical protein